MREPLRTLVLAILTALILAAPSFAQPEPGAENHLRLAANHRGGGAVVPVNRLMRAVKRSNLRAAWSKSGASQPTSVSPMRGASRGMPSSCSKPSFCAGLQSGGRLAASQDAKRRHRLRLRA